MKVKKIFCFSPGFQVAAFLYSFICAIHNYCLSWNYHGTERAKRKRKRKKIPGLMQKHGTPSYDGWRGKSQGGSGNLLVCSDWHARLNQRRPVETSFNLCDSVGPLIGALYGPFLIIFPLKRVGRQGREKEAPVWVFFLDRVTVC